MGAERHALSSSILKAHFLREGMVKGTKKNTRKSDFKLLILAWKSMPVSSQLAKTWFSYNLFFMLLFSRHVLMSLNYSSETKSGDICKDWWSWMIAWWSYWMSLNPGESAECPLRAHHVCKPGHYGDAAWAESGFPPQPSLPIPMCQGDLKNAPTLSILIPGPEV